MQSQSQRCPECGYDPSSGPPPRSPWHWLRMRPTLVVVILAVAIGVWLFLDRTSAVMGSGTPMATLVEPGIRAGDLQAWTADVVSNRGLFDSVLASSSGWLDRLSMYPDLHVYFYLVEATDDYRTERRCGWPLRLWSDTTLERFDDPITRAARQAIQTDGSLAPRLDPLDMTLGAPRGGAAPRPRWDWKFGTLFHKPSPEETGGASVWTSWHAAGIAATMGLVALAWAMGAVLGRYIDVRRRRRSRPRVGRVVRHTAAVLTLLVIAVGSAMSFETSSHVVIDPIVLSRGRLPPSAPKGPARVAIPANELLARVNDPDRDQWLAQQFPSTFGRPITNRSMLASRVDTDWSTGGTVVRWGSRFTLISSVTEDAKYGGAIPGAPMSFPRWSLENSAGSLILRRSAGDTTRHSIVLNLESLGSIAFALSIVFAICHRARALWRRHSSASRRNRCVACGYQLAASDAAGR